MGSVIRAEFRKILTTKTWWALLIPTVAVAFLVAWGIAEFSSDFNDGIQESDVLREMGLNSRDWPSSVFGMARAIHLATVFPMIFGGLAMSSEIRHRTITTSYLTARNRATLLAAKGVVYAAVGALYGVVIVLSASLGIALGGIGKTQILPDGGHWLGLAGAGILETTLWTMLAVGAGAVLRNVVGTVLTLVLWSVVLENLLWLFLLQFDPLPGLLINGSANGISGSIAANTVIDKIGSLEQAQVFLPNAHENLAKAFRIFAGAGGALEWYYSALVFGGWTALFLGLGWLISRSRDVT
jgi:ABC-2 type transport system permease protein